MLLEKYDPPPSAFPYVRTPKSVVEYMPDHSVLGKSDSGWMQFSVFYEYVTNEFDRWIEENRVERPVILFIDGHKSHMTPGLSKICEENKNIFYALPPTTTHMLHPADVSFFRPVKQEWKTTVMQWQHKPENINRSVNKTNFCKLLFDTMENTNMEAAIINGFRKCGLYPLNPDNVHYTKCTQNKMESIERI